MTDNEKSKIIRMRAEGFGYKKIAGELGISESILLSDLICDTEDTVFSVSYTKSQEVKRWNE